MSIICDPSGEWSISREDIFKINRKVAGMLAEKIEKNSKIDLGKFINAIFDEVVTATGDQQRALAVARHIPFAIELSKQVFPDKIRVPLHKNKLLDSAALEDVSVSFTESLDNVATFLNNYRDSLKPKVRDTAGITNSSAAVQPKTKIDVLDYVFVPDDVLTTTGQEVNDERDLRWYYNFLKYLGEQNIYPNADGTINYFGKTLQVSIMTGLSIPVDKLYPYERVKPNIEKMKTNQIFIGFTDTNGDFVYFDDNYNLTDDTGAFIYFPLRTVPKVISEQNGKRIFDIDESVRENRIQPIASIVANRRLAGENTNEELVRDQINQNYNDIKDITDYLLSKGNYKKKLKLNLNRISRGFIFRVSGTEGRKRIDSITNLSDFNPVILDSNEAKGMVKAAFYVTGVDEPIPFSMADFPKELAEKTADLLLNDVYYDGNLITSTDKSRLISQYLGFNLNDKTGPEGTVGFMYSPTTGEILINSKPLSTDKAQAKNEIVDYLTRDISIPTADKEIAFKNKLFFNQRFVNDNFTDFSLSPVSEGFALTTNQDVTYVDWVKDNAYVYAKTTNGEIREENGYIAFEVPIDTLYIARQKMTDAQIKEFKAKQESKTVKPNSVLENNASPSSPTNLADLLMRRDMTGFDVSATPEQIEKAKEDYDAKVITFRDKNGKVVQKKLTDLIPYEVMFNIANSNGNVRATWTRAGITLFQGSDYTDLYHESWHGFTQWFLTGDQKLKLYNEVKNSGETIRYYNNGWKTMNSSKLDFNNPDHILYAEEHLAEKFREYSLGKYTPASAVEKSMFKKIWEAIKALFGFGSPEEVLAPSGLVAKAFQDLKAGNLVDYTFDQANVRFNRLNSGITALKSSTSPIKNLDITSSLMVTEGITDVISASVDELNKEYGTNKFTIGIFENDTVKKEVLRRAKSKLIDKLNELEAKVDLATGFEKDRLDKSVQTLSWAIDNFDIDDVKSGTLKYYNDRTGFFTLSTGAKVIDTETAIDGQTEENTDAPASREGVTTDEGTEFSAVDRMSDSMRYILESLFERVEPTKDNPEGYVYNDLGFRKAVPFKTAFAVIASATANKLTPEEMYKSLQTASDTKTRNKTQNYKFLFIKQLLAKLGDPRNPNAQSLTGQNLISEFFFTFRLDKQTGIQVTAEREGVSLTIKVGTSDSAEKAFGRTLENRFQTGKVKSKYITKNKNNEYEINLKGILEDYPSSTAANASPVSFLRALGIDITDTDAVINFLKKQNAITNIYQTVLDRSKLIDKPTTSLVPERASGLFNDKSSVWNTLLEAESKYSGFNAGYMFKNVNGDPQSEMNNPSTAGNQIHLINAAKTYAELISDPRTAHYSTERNSWVKTSVMFQKLFGKKLTIKNTEDGRPVSINVQSLLGTQALNVEDDIRSLISGMKSAASDVQTAYLRDYFMTLLNGASEAFKHADKSSTYVASLDAGGVYYYVNPKTFTSNIGRNKANEIFIGYIASELERIKKVSSKKLIGEQADDIILGGKPGSYETLKTRGSEFVVFHDIIKDELKEELIKLDVNTVEDFLDLVGKDASLKDKLVNALNNYFDQLALEDYTMLKSFGVTKAENFFKTIKNRFPELAVLSDQDVLKATSEAFTYNAFIHKMEMSTLIYGDPALYTHDKDEHMKRVSGFFATGRIGRTDSSMNAFIAANAGSYHTSQWFKQSGFAAPTNTLSYQSTILPIAVGEDPVDRSVYLDEMIKIAKEQGIPESDYAAYEEMKSADGEAWISFDAYRALEIRFRNWNPQKELLYNKIINNEKTDSAEVLKTFYPVKKLQYSGPLDITNFSALAFHKYSLIPLIPSVIKDSRLEVLHNKMVSEGIAYTVLQSGSKIVSIGKNGTLDSFYDKNYNPKFADPNFKFTKNNIFVDYLKEQLVTKDKFKEEIDFPSQIRKLIVLGMDPESPLIKTYLSNIDKMTKVAETELKMELGYKDVKSRKKGEPALDLKKLLEYVKSSLTAQDLAEQSIDFIEIGDDGKLVRFLDLSEDPSKIEKIIGALVNKRINKQPVYGEQYIQGSSVGFEKFSKPTQIDLDKYGEWGLPFYRMSKDGKSVSAMKIKIALHGKFKNLLKLNHTDNKVIGTIERLNEMLKDENWLNTGEHRQMVTLIGARIPTQGPNSMEFMEVFEFLPEEAGNIMILPLEIVAKSGGDFDIDKLVTMIPGITDNEGVIEIEKPKSSRKLLNTIIEEKYELINEIKEIRKKYLKSYLTPELQEQIDSLEKEQSDAYQEFLSQWTNNYYVGGATEKYYSRISNAKQAIDSIYEQFDQDLNDQYNAEVEPVKEKLRQLNREENFYKPKAYQQDVLNSMRAILSRPDNYINLTRPNGTGIYTEGSEDAQFNNKSIVEFLAEFNRVYNKKFTKTNPLGKKKISPTRIMENGYNISKAAALFTGKMGVGMLATGNTFHASAVLADVYMSPFREEEKLVNKVPVTYKLIQQLLIPHNFKIVDGEKVIDFSKPKDADLKNYVRDVVSELMNGYLDVAKDEWVYDINAVKQLEPEFEFMLLAGVPVKTAALMLAQPLVRQYLNKFKEYSSPYALFNPEDNLSNTNFAKRQALIDVLLKNDMSSVFPMDDTGEPNTFLNTPALLETLRAQYLQGDLKSNRNALILEKARLEGLEEVTVGTEYEIYFDKSDSVSILTVQSITPKKNEYSVVLKNEKSGKEYTYTVNKFGEGKTMRFEEPVTFIDVTSEINRLSKQIADADIELEEAPQGEFPNLVIGDKVTETLNRRRDESGNIKKIEVPGEFYKVEVPGHSDIRLYLSKNDYGTWVVEEFYSGLPVGSGSTPSIALADAEKKLKENLSNIKKGDKGYEIAKEIKADVKKLTPPKGKAKSVKPQESPEILFNNEKLIDNLRKPGSSLSKQHFAHFAEIIYMASQLTNLKMGIRFDTLKNTSYFDADQQEKGFEATLGKAFPADVVNRLIDKTVLKSFRTGAFLKEVIGTLLPVRANSKVNNAIGSIIKGMSDLSMDDKEKLASQFNTDLLLYIFQNKLYSFDSETDTYRSADITETVAPIAKEQVLKRGAFLNPNTGVMHVDKAQIIKEFKSKAFTTPSYGGESRLAPLPASIFDRYKTENRVKLYYKFVLERESLRDAYPYNETINSFEFQNFLVMIGLNTDIPMRYEEFIRNKALENLYLDGPLFGAEYKFNGMTTAVDKFLRILETHPELVTAYPVLDIIGTVKSGSHRFFKLNDRISDGTVLTAYKDQMAILADPGQIKVKNTEENLYISQFFAKLNTIGYLQAGNNKNSELYMMSILDMKPISSYVQNTINDVMNSPKLDGVLEDFESKFTTSFARRKSFAFTNYAFNAPYTATDKATVEDQPLLKYIRNGKVKTGSIFINEETGEIEDVYKYNESMFETTSKVVAKDDTELTKRNYKITETDVQALFQINPEATYVFEDSYPKVTLKEDGSLNIGQRPTNPTRIEQEAFRAGLATGNSFAIPITKQDGSIPAVEKNAVPKELIDMYIQELVNLRDSGKTIIFPSEGIGNKLLGFFKNSLGNLEMRKEGAKNIDLYLYLSKKLLENFGYRNPKMEMITKNFTPELLEGAQTGLEFIQQFYINKSESLGLSEPLQTLTDKEVNDYINKCKGIS
jgi:hypothetical protein